MVCIILYNLYNAILVYKSEKVSNSKIWNLNSCKYLKTRCENCAKDKRTNLAVRVEKRKGLWPKMVGAYFAWTVFICEMAGLIGIGGE